MKFLDKIGVFGLMILMICMLIVLIFLTTSDSQSPISDNSNEKEQHLHIFINSMIREYMKTIREYIELQNIITKYRNMIHIDKENLPDITEFPKEHIPLQVYNALSEEYEQYVKQMNEKMGWKHIENISLKYFLEKRNKKQDSLNPNFNISPAGYYEIDNEELIPFPITGTLVEYDMKEDDKITIFQTPMYRDLLRLIKDNKDVLIEHKDQITNLVEDAKLFQ
tara:strand:- start:790 stop:1458 length:669 start_codon:yes stop_codon:yes gene_type:complete